MGARQWLSEGAESLVRELDETPAGKFHCDVLIVGSGYGGAVAAARLAGARDRETREEITVFVLERGREYLPGMFPARFAEVPGHVRFSTQDGAPPKGRAEGLFDVRLGGQTTVVVANGLGGGSLINAAVMERPKPEAFARGWPAGIDLKSLGEAYGKVERMLQVDDFAGTPDAKLPKLVSLQSLGRAMGAQDMHRARLAIRSKAGRTEAGVERDKCLQCGDCVTGCNHRAKNSLDVNYLKMARDARARLFCGATVHDVTPGADGGWAVRFFFTDRGKGYAEKERLFTLRSRRVVLAAGALGSTEILLRSKEAGLSVSDQVGERFSGNGDMIHGAWRQRLAVHGSAREQDAPDQRHIGPTINGMVFRKVDDLPGANPWLLFQEFAIPAPLRRVLGEVIACSGGLFAWSRADRTTHRADFKGDDPAAVSDEALERTAIYGMMGDDGADGKIELVQREGQEFADAQVKVTAPNGKVFHSQLGLLLNGQAASPELRGIVVPNPLWQPLPRKEATLGRTATVHPLGGCAMADDLSSGGVDSCGRVFRPAGGTHPGLVVLDGSIVPGALAVNPALTIAALAERAMPLLRDEWALDAPPDCTPQPQAQPAWAAPPAARQPAPTAIELDERMTGAVMIGGTGFEASLTVTFAPIDDVQAFVRRLPRTVALPCATLRLVGAGGARATIEASGHANVLHRADTTPFQRLLKTARALRRVALDDKYKLLFLTTMQHGEVRTIDYALTVRRVQGGAPLRPGDRLLLHKRLTLAKDGTSPWRQLSEGRLEVESGGKRRAAGTLCLDTGYFVERAQPLLRIFTQQDQPNALGDLAELALFVVRLVLKIRMPHLLEALLREPPPSAKQERLPGPFGYHHDGKLLQPLLDSSIAVGAGTTALLARYRPPDGMTRGRPVLLIHGLGASGSTFAHRSIGAPSKVGASENLVAALLRTRREVWVLDLRTSIGQPVRERVRLEDVACGDIGPAIEKLGEIRRQTGLPEERVDVVAHCIGAVMFCIAALEPGNRGKSLSERIGAVVLSQVGPLMRMGAMNRFRGYVASYLQRFVNVREFDVRPEDTPGVRFLDALLSTFPYPAGDRERERAEAVPGFEVIRHRADAIWGRLMELDNVGDRTLAALDAIYGWVVVRTLAQTIHFARHGLITDASGANEVVAQQIFGERFDFPVLLLHGERNAMFDWRGAYDSLWLLKKTFDDGDLPDREPPTQPPGEIGAGTPRRLRVIPGYGHQDCLIGQRAHVDVFPAIIGFLDEFAVRDPHRSKRRPLEFVADLPWMGPTLGWVKALPEESALLCRLALRASPARADTLVAVFVPARREGGGWRFDYDEAAAKIVDRNVLRERCIDVKLAVDRLPDYGGFAVVTLHNDVPAPRGPDPRINPRDATGRMFKAPSDAPIAEMLDAVRVTLESRADVDTAVVRLDPAWIAAADRGKPAPAHMLSFVVASCQYPKGIVDTAPAQQTYERLLRRLDAGPKAQLMLLIGDQVYVDETAGLFDPGAQERDLERSYELTLRLPAFRAATRRLPTCFMLDDHEVVDNWEPGRRIDAGPALRAYREHQHKLAPDGKAGPPFRYELCPAGFPFFVLDTRSARDARVVRGGGVVLEEARIVPESVIRELESWLDKGPKDVPRFIVSPSVVFPFDRLAIEGAEVQRLGMDSWSGYPASLVRLLTLIAQGGHRHVVFLSGDAHLSLVSTLSYTAAGRDATVHSIVSSGLHAPWPFANSRHEDLWLEGGFTLQHVGTELHGSAETAAFGAAQGFCIVHVQRRAEGGWRLAVELDQADGITRCERMLGEAQARWQVQRPPA